jgi:hypothetical protein
VRGRAGSYAEAFVDTRTGRAAMLAALAELGLGADAGGRGVLSADPRRAAVDRVVTSYLIEAGAEGQEARLRLYEEELRRLAANPAPKADEDGIAAAEAALSAAIAARRAAEEAVKALATNMPGESPLARRLAAL